MKSILLSIQPKWCRLIASGKKTVEIRKTAPKIKTPFKCYIYCTLSGSKELFSDTLKEDVALWNREKWWERKGKVIGEFVCDNIVKFPVDKKSNNIVLTNMQILSCLGYEQIEQYAKGNYYLYSWHISNLVIYDKPKELSEFYKPCTDPYHYCQGCDYGFVQYPSDVETYEDLSGCYFDTICLNRITRPPQNWHYVEELEG